MDTSPDEPPAAGRGSPAGGRAPDPADLAWLPFFLQTVDATFPVGAYAHSGGLEESVRLGLVRDEPTLGWFVERQVVPALTWQELPYLRFAHAAAQAADLAALGALDRGIDAWKTAAEARAASRQVGGRRLRALGAVSADPRLAAFAAEVAAGRAAGHHLVVCGLQAAAGNVPLTAALHAYFFQTLAGCTGAALKLIRIGQEGCQRVLRAGGRHAAAAVRTSGLVARTEAGWFNPLGEIAAMRHAHADERLFIS